MNLPFSNDFLLMGRAISDIKRGVPVLLHANGKDHLVFSAETINQSSLTEIIGKATLYLTGKRAHRLDENLSSESLVSGAVSDTISREKLHEVIGVRDNENVGAFAKKLSLQEDTNNIGAVAIQLMKHAELLPACIIVSEAQAKDWKEALPLVTLVEGQIKDYQEQAADSLEEMSEAPLCLAEAKDAAIKIYRPQGGDKEHYAIIIGNAQQAEAPVVRIHSSCYTGDILSSLRCDCRDQLHEAIAFMGKEENGGIILYLNQEGRGIGLPNKIRTYDLQEKGMDTVDANEALGFDDDERPFSLAAKMLEKLSVTSVRLLTNNHRKAKGLESCGIKVVECVSHVVEAHEHNRDYLQTKADRLGHKL